MSTFIKWGRKRRSWILLSIGVAFAVTACKKDNNSNNPPKPPAAPGVQLIANTQFGNILTDSAGRTLYFFSIDADSTSGCTGGCVTAWPVFYTTNAARGTGLDPNDFGAITRTDGKPQTTYKGWPLYYFQNDAAQGDVKGEALNNIWYVAKPDYSVMLVNKQLTGHDGIQYNGQFQPGLAVTQYITDDRGRTLYSFSSDHFRKNIFTHADFSNDPIWPIDTSGKVRSIPSILDKSKFDTLTVFGKVQLVYNGWPLYHFGQDSLRRGNNKGISFPHPGVWPYVNGGSAVAPQ